MAPSGCGLVAMFAVSARVIVGAVLVFAALTKMLNDSNREAVAEMLAALRIRPSRWFAMTLALTELLLGSLLLSGTMITGAAVAAMGLFAAFTVGLIILVVGGYASSCACFGRLDQGAPGPAQIARNGWLLAVSVFLTWALASTSCVDASVTEVPAPVWISAAGALGVSIGLYMIGLRVQSVLRTDRQISD